MKQRELHVKNIWLNRKALFGRFTSSPSKQPYSYMETRKKDFEFTIKFMKYLHCYIKEENIPVEELEDYIFILKTHKTKSSYRFHFLLITAACIAGLGAIFREIDIPITGYFIIVFLVGFLALNERAFLMDKVSATEELICILERLIEYGGTEQRGQG